MHTFIQTSSYMKIDKIKKRFRFLDMLHILQLESLFKDTFIGFTPCIYYKELTEDIEYFKHKYSALFIPYNTNNIIYEFKYDNISFYCLGR